jgi:hypothetical protein
MNYIDSGCTGMIVDCWLWVKKLKSARIICWPRDSTLRPTPEARIWYHSGAAGIDITINLWWHEPDKYRAINFFFLYKLTFDWISPCFLHQAD